MNINNSKAKADSFEQGIKIIGFFSALVILVIMLVSIGSILHPVYIKQQGELRRDSEILAELTAQSANEFFRSISFEAKLMAADTQFHEIMMQYTQGQNDPERFRQQISPKLLELLDFDSKMLGITYFDQNGSWLASMGEPVVAQYRPPNPGKFTETTIIGPVEIWGKLQFLVTTPFFNDNAIYSGSKVVSFAASALLNKFENETFDKILDNHEIYLAFASEAQNPVITPLSSRGFKMLMSRRDIEAKQPGLWTAGKYLDKITSKYTYENDTSLFFVHPLGLMDAEVIVHKEKQSFLQAAQLFISKLALPALLLVIVLTFTIYKLFISLSRTYSSRSKQLLYESTLTINAIADAIVIWNKFGSITAFNHAAVRIFGYPDGELLGLNYTELVIPPDRPSISVGSPFYNKNDDIGAVYKDLEVTGVSKEGNTVSMEVTVLKAYISGERLFVATFHDISYQLEREKKIRESEERLTLALNAAGMGMWSWMIQKDVLYFDKRFKQLCGKENVESIDNFAEWAETIDPDDLPRVEQKIHKSLADGSPYDVQYRSCWPDGSRHHINVQGLVIRDAQEEPVQMIGVGIDVTEEVLVHEDLEQAKLKADQANIAKSGFLAVMSHEIRTPMNGVIGMLELLEQDDLSVNQQDMLSTARSSCHALLEIINEILDFSKIEAGKLDIQITSVDLFALTENTIKMLLPTARDKNLHLNLYFDSDIPAIIETDSLRFRQILLNLLGNAIKFTHVSDGKAGKIDIRLQRIRGAQRDCLCLSITDTGIGMSDEQTKLLFTPFMQADTSTHRKFGGTGLGLAISKQLTGLLGGEISVESEPGSGSTFTVLLPLKEHKGHLDTALQKTLSGLHPWLCIGDENLKATVSAYLLDAEINWVAVDDLATLGKRFSESVSRHRAPDFVIMDTEALQRLTQQERDRLVSVLNKWIYLKKDPVDLLTNIKATFSVSARPLLRSELLENIAYISGRASPNITYQSSDFPIVDNYPSIDQAERDGSLILVAEDNPTNQKVIRRQLNGLGYACEIAEDGIQAMAMLKQRNYALLLTDCHMPNMDGYQLTQEIRSQEQPAEHLPIIAITANALQGESERCIELGMDDYISKPIALKTMNAVLKKWLSKKPSDDLATQQPTLDDLSRAVVDVSVLVDLIGGDDPEFIEESLQEFLATATEIAAKMSIAYEAKSLADIQSLAHILKSSSRTVGALRLGEYCEQLEQAVEQQDWSKVKSSYDGFKTVWVEVEGWLLRRIQDAA